MQTKVLAAENKSFYSSLSVLRISVGIVYLWFGALKFFQGVSPAEQLAAETIHRITFGLISDHTNLMLLAIWECLIGVMLIIGKFIKPVLVLMFLHMICTFTPFIFFHKKHFAICLTGSRLRDNISLRTLYLLPLLLYYGKLNKIKIMK